MKRLLIAVTVVLTFASLVLGADFTTPVDRVSADMSNIEKMMSKGQMLIVEEKPNGSLSMVTGGIIINATPEKVYEVLVAYDNYTQFMPSTTRCKVVSEQGDTKDVAFTIEFKFTILSWKVDYVLRHTFVPNKEIRWKLLSSKDNKLKDTIGAWQLFPLPGGKTAAFYSVYSDIKSISWAIKKAFESEPSMEISVNASSCVMVLKAIKMRVENPTYAPNLKK